MLLRRTHARLLAAPAAAGVLLLSMAAPASAHVTATPTTTAAGSYTVLTFSAGHGKDGAPTTRVTIQIPKEILSVTPTRNPYWDVTVQTETLAAPVTDAHGNEVTERDAVVVYTAKEPLPDGVRDTFALSMQLPEDAEGTTLAFPAIQDTPKGQLAWTEIAAEGQDPEELESPAPTITVTEPEEGGHGTAGSTDDAGHDDQSDADASADDEDGDGNALGLAGLGAGLGGLALGGLALARTRRQA